MAFLPSAIQRTANKSPSPALFSSRGCLPYPAPSSFSATPASCARLTAQQTVLYPPSSTAAFAPIAATSAAPEPATALIPARSIPAFTPTAATLSSTATDAATAPANAVSKPADQPAADRDLESAAIRAASSLSAILTTAPFKPVAPELSAEQSTAEPNFPETSSA